MPIEPRGPGGGQKGFSAAVCAADATFTSKPVAAAVKACVVHWIKVSLRGQPDLKSRPAWWPPAKTGIYDGRPYPSEPFEADTTAGKKSGSLDSHGMVTFQNIPAGTCQIQFKKFYEEINKYFEETLKS